MTELEEINIRLDELKTLYIWDVALNRAGASHFNKLVAKRIQLMGYDDNLYKQNPTGVQHEIKKPKPLERIKILNDEVRVRCLECQTEHHIKVHHTGTEKQQRSLGYEYEYIFVGGAICGNCGDHMKLEYLVFEYPKEFVNYIDVENEGCLQMYDLYYDKNELDFSKEKNNDKK